MRGAAYATWRAACAMARRPRSAALAVGAIAVGLVLLGGVRLAGDNVDDATAGWSRGVQMVVYLEDGTSADRAQQIRGALEQLPGVAATRYVGPDAALGRLRESLGEHDELAADLGADMLPASIEVSLADGVREVASAAPIVDRLEGVRGVDEVELLGPWVERASGLASGLRRASWLLLILVGLACAYVVSITLRLSMARRRAEIDTLELLGATPGFVRAPLVVEGMLHGAAGGLVALGVLWLLYHVTHQAIAAALTHAFGAGTVGFLSPAELALLVAAGAFFGLAGSLSATGRRALARS